MAVTRRLTLANVQLGGRTWEEIRFELQRFLEALNATTEEGVAPPGHSTQDPEPIGDAPDAGDPLTGWSPGDHVHTAAAGNVSYVPTGALTSTTVQGAIDELDAVKLGHTRTMIRVSVGF